MKNEEFETLAHTKSPKTAKRTTFQDELMAALHARKNKTDLNSYPDDFDEDEDDFLNELLKSSTHPTDASEAQRNKAKMDDFDLSEDEVKHNKSKRVSFLKSARNPSPPQEREPVATGDSVVSPDHERDDLESDFKHHLPNVGGDGKQFESDGLESTTQESQRSLKSESDLEEGTERHPGESSATSDHEHLPPESQISTPPRPKPRQRHLAINKHTAEKTFDVPDSLDTSRPQTSTESLDASSTVPQVSSPDRISAKSCSPQLTDEESEESDQMTSCEVVPGLSGDASTSKESKDLLKISTSFNVPLSKSAENVTFDFGKSSRGARPRSSHKFHSVESKYLGSLKLLDSKVPHDCPAKEADSLRATIYQEWLRKKEQKSRESLELSRKEKLLSREKKKEEELKRADAAASYEAWKQKKAESLKAQFREKQCMMEKEKQNLEDNKEKRKSSKQMFEQWKKERENILKEKYRKQKEADKSCQLKKQEEEEELMRNRKIAFSSWYEKKKNVIHHQVATERKQGRNKEEEERYIKEEKDRNAIEIYEQWLARKDLEKRRRKNERHIREILQDSPPPPWSPPNKTTSLR